MPISAPFRQEYARPSQDWMSQPEPAQDETGLSESIRIPGECRSVRTPLTCKSSSEFIGQSSAMRCVLERIEIVAPTDASVLILGETGTGKELVARAIHRLSNRRRQTLAKINCAAIPSGLLESELFGHEKGSFTGAISRRTGRFELADRGTLFLDEIGDFPVGLQPKLLRVLQEKEFERVGSNRTQPVDVRLIAATSRNLPQMVADREFRMDLYYRLNVFPIRIPPLRERASDIPLLVWHFVEQFSRSLNKVIEIISSEVMEALRNYPWPGNIRELQNFIERAVILSPGRVLNVPLDELEPPSTICNGSGAPLGTKTATLQELEREHILKALTQTRWLVGGPNGAAVVLGLNRTTLLSKMQKLGISRRSKIEK